ncbi:MAG TPA: hypothetical protein VMT89_05020, partial [Candidatus Acidoferrales bacterium]|nr:hypothetical protein [Candidatus Acidoferrales bacterium]
MPGGRLSVPAGFERIRDGHMEIVARHDTRSWLVPVLRAAPHDWSGQSVEHRRGGRGGVVTLHVNGRPCLIRAYRRGGLPAWVLRSLYFGRRPRPFRELAVTESL